MGNYRPFLQGPLPVANYTRIIIPGRFWTRPPSTKSTRMASSATPLHDSLIELAIPDAHAHAIKWYLKLSTGGKLVVSHLLEEIKGRRKCNSYRHRESLAVMNDVYMIHKKAWLIYHVLGPLVISSRYYFAKCLFLQVNISQLFGEDRMPEDTPHYQVYNAC